MKYIITWVIMLNPNSGARVSNGLVDLVNHIYKPPIKVSNDSKEFSTKAEARIFYLERKIESIDRKSILYVDSVKIDSVSN